MVDQTSQFYAILTNTGAAKQANADALGIAWSITHMGVGDGNPGNVENPALPQPSATWTALLNEWRRAPLNQLKVDEKDASIIVAEQVIPADIGGRWIREIGLYDADGDLVAVANCAPTYKPLLSQGSGRTQVVRMNLLVSSSSNVQLKIDPSVVLATREYVDSLTVRASQAEAEAGTESSKIMTPLRVFQAIAKVVVQATETVFGWAKVATQAQVTTGTDDKTIVTPKKLRGAQATKAEAETGTDDTKLMTPVRSLQSIIKQLNLVGLGTLNPPELAGFEAFVPSGLYTAYAGGSSSPTPGGPPSTGNNVLSVLAISPRPQATHYFVMENGQSAGVRRMWFGQWYSGTMLWTPLLAGDQIATQAQVNAGTDDATVVTPKKMRNGFSVSLTANGYIVFPSWLGGLVIQWGTANVSAGPGVKSASFPMAFPTSVWGMVCSGILDNLGATYLGACRASSLAAFEYALNVYASTTGTVSVTSSSNTPGLRWIAIGN